MLIVFVKYCKEFSGIFSNSSLLILILLSSLCLKFVFIMLFIVIVSTGAVKDPVSNFGKKSQYYVI